MTPVQVAWERTLEAEGLAPLDAGHRDNHTIQVSHRGTYSHTNHTATTVNLREGIEHWLSWAKDIGRTFHFRDERERRIWRALAEGRRYDDIQAALGVTSQDIARTVADVELMAPGPKPRNPWRKDGRKEATMAKQQAAHLGQPQSTTGWEQQAAAQAAHAGQLLGQALPPPRPRPKFTYTRILMRRGLTFKVPGISVEKDTLRDIEGRPHVGGIDVVCTVEDFPGLKDGVPVVITLPWWKIDQADRALEV